MKRSITAASIAAFATIAAARSARADQCLWVTEAQAQRAVELLRAHRDAIAFCEPCGETVPGPPFQVRTAIHVAVPDARAVVVNGDEVDLAYTYVRTSDHEYRNLAELTGCPASVVSTTLRVDRATPTSVIIRSAPSAPLAAGDSRVSQPEPACVRVPPERPSALWVFCSGSLLTALAALLVRRAARRRRMDHLPRAAILGLPDRESFRIGLEDASPTRRVE